MAAEAATVVLKVRVDTKIHNSLKLIIYCIQAVAEEATAVAEEATAVAVVVINQVALHIRK